MPFIKLCQIKLHNYLTFLSFAFQVLIGNRVWIKKSIYEAKVASLSVKNTIALGDLAEAVWGLGGLAERSLEGGVSPRNPQAPRKVKASPGKREAILGKRKIIFSLLTTFYFFISFQHSFTDRAVSN